MNYLVSVTNLFLDCPGGSARVAWDIACLMRDRGHRVGILCRKQKPGDADTCEIDGIHITRFPFPRTHTLDPFKLRKRIRCGVQAARELLGDFKPDVVHSHQVPEGHIAWQAFGNGPRHVYTVHSSAILEQKINWLSAGLPGRIKWIFGRRILRNLEEGILRKADRIHCLSQYTRSLVEEDYGLGSQVEVIPHWCRANFQREKSKLEARRLLQWPAEAKFLFSVRRLGPRYGLDVAIKAAAPLLRSRPDLYYAIAGDGQWATYLRELARSLGVAGKVLFLGRVRDDLLQRCYEAADLFLLPTVSLECFGLIVLESYAFGLPVLGTDVGAIPELVGPISPQMIVPAHDVEAMGAKLEQFVNGRLEVPSAQAIHAYIAGNYSPQAVVPRLARFLEDWPAR